MNSYKVYLMKSSGVAARLAKSYSGEQSTPDIVSISHGMVTETTVAVPAIYRDMGYHYCIVTLAENGEHDAPEYELTVC